MKVRENETKRKEKKNTKQQTVHQIVERLFPLWRVLVKGMSR